MIDPVTAGTVAVVIFLAELPDKSLLASLVLATRFRARWVWIGVSAAFLVHVTLAVLAGGLLTLAPRRLVETVVAVLLAAGAVLLLRPEREERSRVTVLEGGRGAWTAMATSFGLVFVGEFGDVTQLATANLAARYEDPLSVGVGAAVGLLVAAGLAVRLGGTLVRRFPLTVIRRAAGLLLAVLAVLTAVAAVGG